MNVLAGAHVTGGWLQEHNELDEYARIVGADGTQEEFLAIAKAFESKQVGAFSHVYLYCREFLYLCAFLCHVAACYRFFRAIS